jgi:hypothetical protein
MDCARYHLSACVVKGLPNARDYAYKNREMLLEEKRQRQMAMEMERNWKEQEQQVAINFENEPEQ